MPYVRVQEKWDFLIDFPQKNVVELTPRLRFNVLYSFLLKILTEFLTFCVKKLLYTKKYKYILQVNLLA